MSRVRITLIDSIRGISILSMVLYHLVYDFRFIFNQTIPGYSLTFDHIWQQSICWCFILLSGMCRNFSIRHIRRGLTLLGCGLLITIITQLLAPDQAIHFGILSMIGCAVLLSAPMLPLLKKVHPWVGASVCFVLFLLLRGVPKGYIGFASAPIALPDALYQFRILAPLGFPSPDFHSSDYFPLLPWFFLFLTGYFLWRVVENIPRLHRIFTLRLPVADFFGRYTLQIYLLHQPIILAALYLILQ